MRRKRLSNIKQQVKMTRALERKERVDALRDGRKQRAHTFANKKHKNNKNACRGRFS